MLTYEMEHGIALWKKGQKTEARLVFNTIIKNDRQNEKAWIWYIYCLETAGEKIAVLENFLRMFPNHKAALHALENLRMSGGQNVPVQTQQKHQSQKNRNVNQSTRRPLQSAHVVQRSRVSPIIWLLTIFAVCLLLASSIFVTSRYNSILSEVQILRSDNQVMTQNYSQLSQDFQSLNSTNKTLLSENEDLIGRQNSLNTEYSLLSEKFATLTGSYANLNTIALKPPYIFVHDRKVDATFYGADGQLISWVTPFSDLEYDIENGANTRRLIVDKNDQTKTVSRKDGSLVWIRDFSIFITPRTFQNLTPELYVNSATPYEFIHQVWYMIGQLSNYASEEIETPRYSLETLLAGGGDCEDLSILLASMIKAAPVDWYVDLVYVDRNNINDPQVPNHVVVYINTGQETFIVEATDDQDMLPYDEGVTGWMAGSLQSEHDPQPIFLH
jgi:hypothetical protein